MDGIQMKTEMPYNTTSAVMGVCLVTCLGSGTENRGTVRQADEGLMVSGQERALPEAGNSIWKGELHLTWYNHHPSCTDLCVIFIGSFGIRPWSAYRILQVDKRNVK